MKLWFNERNGEISWWSIIFHLGNVIPYKEPDLHLVSKIKQNNSSASIVRPLLNEFAKPNDAKQWLRKQQQSEEATTVMQITETTLTTAY